MVRYTSIKPDCFSELPGGPDFRYFDLYYDGRVYGHACLDFRFKPYCALHLEVLKWNHLIFKELTQKDWNFAKNIIRSLDCDQVVLTKKGIIDEQGSYMKLIKACGFSQPVQFTQAQQEI